MSTMTTKPQDDPATMSFDELHAHINALAVVIATAVADGGVPVPRNVDRFRELIDERDKRNTRRSKQ